jgi:alginate O-acetyltransferase complex protein AlgI
MSFTSLSYYLFLAISLIVFFNAPKRWRHPILIIANFVFYLSFNPRYVVFILTTIFVSYFSARVMCLTNSSTRKKIALYIALSIELVLLSLTKYWNPFVQATHIFSPIRILIPLGISFYTFQSLGYLLDVYRGLIKAELNLPRYIIFISFFPHLLAGPIEPAQHFLPQIQNSNPLDRKSLAFGILLILTGLFKKLVIADQIGPIVDLVFNNPQLHHGMAIAFATFLARYQIYCDFSGYTDIALGSAMMFGYNLSINFNRPFFSTSISEYWRRWHISLTNWIRKYVFYPLLTTPATLLGIYGIILITFLVLGLWHGGTFNFLLYGIIQGMLIILDISTKDLRQKIYLKTGLSTYPRFLNSFCISFTFIFLIVPPTLVFRSPYFATSLLLIKNLTSISWSFSQLAFIFNNENLKNCLITAISGIILFEFVDWIQKTKFNIAEFIWLKPFYFYYTVIFLFLLTILFLGKFETGSRFIYTQF